MLRTLSLLVGLAVFLFTANALSDPGTSRNLINTQGRLTTKTGTPVQGDHSFRLRIYRADGSVAFDETQITSKENRSNPQHGDPSHTLAKDGRPPAIAFQPHPDMTEHRDQSPTIMQSNSQQPCVFEPRFARNDRGAPSDVVPPLKAQSGMTGKGDSAPCIAFTERTRDGDRSLESQEGIAYALDNPGRGGRTQTRQVMTPAMTVRRLTPRECERLQGFPDDYTRIPWRGKPAENCPDGPRYKALGNSMAVPCMVWIGKRIQAVELLVNG